MQNSTGDRPPADLDIFRLHRKDLYVKIPSARCTAMQRRHAYPVGEQRPEVEGIPIFLRHLLDLVAYALLSPRAVRFKIDYTPTYPFLKSPAVFMSLGRFPGQ